MSDTQSKTTHTRPSSSDCDNSYNCSYASYRDSCNCCNVSEHSYSDGRASYNDSYIGNSDS